jgi:hypothetical protein
MDQFSELLRKTARPNLGVVTQVLLGEASVNSWLDMIHLTPSRSILELIFADNKLLSHTLLGASKNCNFWRKEIEALHSQAAPWKVVSVYFALDMATDLFYDLPHLLLHTTHAYHAAVVRVMLVWLLYWAVIAGVASRNEDIFQPGASWNTFCGFAQTVANACRHALDLDSKRSLKGLARAINRAFLESFGTYASTQLLGNFQDSSMSFLAEPLSALLTGGMESSILKEALKRWPDFAAKVKAGTR